MNKTVLSIYRTYRSEYGISYSTHAKSTKNPAFYIGRVLVMTVDLI